TTLQYALCTQSVGIGMSNSNQYSGVLQMLVPFLCGSFYQDRTLLYPVLSKPFHEQEYFSKDCLEYLYIDKRRWWTRMPLLLDSTEVYWKKLLKIHLQYAIGATHVQIPLLFPNTKRFKKFASAPKARTSTIHLLYSSLDRILRNFDTMQLNPAACLLLPFIDVMHSVVPNRSYLPIASRHLLVGSLMSFNLSTQVIEWKPATDIPEELMGPQQKLIQAV
ncbi:hypothetical protein CU098_007178, partial [Rhizopus stolonifer]